MRLANYSNEKIMHRQGLAAIIAVGLVLVLLFSGTALAFVSAAQATTTQSSDQTKESHELKYRMNGTGGQSGQGEANIQIQGTSLHVNIEIEHAAKMTTYSVILIAIPTPSSGGTSFGTSAVGGTSGVGTTTTTQNVCTNSIGQLVTSKEGQGIAHLETSLTAGTYQIGVVLCIGSTPAIVSQPATQEGIITQGQGNDDISNLKHDVQSVTPITLGSDGNNQIQGAEHHGTIDAVVGHGYGDSPKLSDVNSDFTVAAGALGSSGLIVSMSSASAVGPAAILVNLGSVPIATMLKGLAVTFDGAVINPVSSIAQVLNPPAGQSNYVLLQTASGLELLMSVPHFSDDIVQILPVFAYNWVFISAAGFALAATIGAVVLFYRKSYLPVPIFG